MPHLRIYTPDISFEQKKIMAAELTDALAAAFRIALVDRESISIQFIPYRLENVALGGRLISETEEPVYRLELFASEPTPAAQQSLRESLFPLSLELMGLPPSESHRLSLAIIEQQEPVSRFAPQKEPHQAYR